MKSDPCKLVSPETLAHKEAQAKYRRAAQALYETNPGFIVDDDAEVVIWESNPGALVQVWVQIYDESEGETIATDETRSRGPN